MTAPTTPDSGAVLHVVMGERGEYSDHSVWSVAAYTDRAQAEEHVRLANEWCRDVEKKAEEDWNYEKPEKNPYDVGMISWGHDTTYSVSTLFVHISPDKYRVTTDVLTDYCKEQGWIPH